MSPGVLLSEAWQSWRASLRRPGFVLLAGLTLALGVGFSAPLLNLLLQLRAPIDAAQPQQLMLLTPAPPGSWSPVHYRDYEALRKLPGVASVGLFRSSPTYVNVNTGVHSLLVQALRVNREYLATLGTRMVQGRYFSAAEDQPHGPGAVIVGYRFWQQQLGGGPVVGRDVRIDGHYVPVAGVLPRQFPTLGSPDIQMLLPLQHDAAKPDAGNVVPVARLQDGANPARVAGITTTRIRSLETQAGNAYTQQITFHCWPFSQAVDQTPPGLPLLLLLSTGVLMLVVAGNLANLLLTRAQQARQGLALRAALGAPVLRLLLGSWSEGVLIALVGGAAGVMVGTVVVHVLQAQIGMFMPMLAAVPASLATQLEIVVPLALLVTAASALAATWRVHRLGNALSTLHGANASADFRASRSSRALVIAQTALATALVGVGLLFAGAAYRAGNVVSGFDSQDVYQFHVVPPKMQYPDARSQLRLMQDIMDGLRTIPGVESAGASDFPWFNAVFEDAAALPSGHTVFTRLRYFTGGYAQALRIRLIQGQPPQANAGDAQPLIWVNQAFVHRYLKGVALGQRIGLGSGADKITLTVAGVVGDTYTSQRQHQPMLWIPINAATNKAGGALGNYGLDFIVRLRPGMALPKSDIEAKVHTVAPTLAVAHLRKLSNDAPYQLQVLWALAQVAIALAVATLALAGVGMYAITRVVSGARLREFGVRLALGASPLRLLLQVLRGALLRTLIGLLLGSVLAVLLGLMMRALLLSLGATWVHPWSLALTWGVLLAVGLLAALPPALRAARTPPTVTLNESAQ